MIAITMIHRRRRRWRRLTLQALHGRRHDPVRCGDGPNGRRVGLPEQRMPCERGGEEQQRQRHNLGLMTEVLKAPSSGVKPPGVSFEDRRLGLKSYRVSKGAPHTFKARKLSRATITASSAAALARPGRRLMTGTPLDGRGRCRHRILLHLPTVAAPTVTATAAWT